MISLTLLRLYIFVQMGVPNISPPHPSSLFLHLYPPSHNAPVFRI